MSFIVLLGDSIKVMLAGNIREKLNPHNIHIINRISGIILIIFGVALMWGMITHKLPHSSVNNETSKALMSFMTRRKTELYFVRRETIDVRYCEPFRTFHVYLLRKKIFFT